MKPHIRRIQVAKHWFWQVTVGPFFVLCTNCHSVKDYLRGLNYGK